MTFLTCAFALRILIERILYDWTTSPMLSVSSPPKLISFDCYGTLVRWHEVMQQEIAKILEAHFIDQANAPAILAKFSVLSRRLTAEKPHRLYRDILRIGFTAAFRDYKCVFR